MSQYSYTYEASRRLNIDKGILLLWVFTHGRRYFFRVQHNNPVETIGQTGATTLIHSLRGAWAPHWCSSKTSATLIITAARFSREQHRHQSRGAVLTPREWEFCSLSNPRNSQRQQRSSAVHQAKHRRRSIQQKKTAFFHCRAGGRGGLVPSCPSRRLSYGCGRQQKLRSREQRYIRVLPLVLLLQFKFLWLLLD